MRSPGRTTGPFYKIINSAPEASRKTRSRPDALVAHTVPTTRTSQMTSDFSDTACRKPARLVMITAEASSPNPEMAKRIPTTKSSILLCQMDFLSKNSLWQMMHRYSIGTSLLRVNKTKIRAIKKLCQGFWVIGTVSFPPRSPTTRACIA